MDHRPDHNIAQSAKPPPPLPDRGAIPELSELILACRHHLLLTGLLGIGAAIVLAAIAWSVIDPGYQAEALVRVREQQNVVFAAQTSRAEDLAFFRSQAKLVQSPQVLAAALRDPAVAQLAEAIPVVDRVEWLRGLLRVETESGSEVMSIAVMHHSPQVSQTLCNAVTESYLTEVNDRLNNDRRQRQMELERVAREADAKLDQLWNQLNHTAQSVGSDSSESLTIRDELKLQSYRDLSRQLQAAQRRGNELQSSLAVRQQALQSQTPVDDSQLETLLPRDPEVTVARERLADIELQIHRLRKIAASDDAPRVQRLVGERDFFAAQLEEAIARVRSRVQAETRDQHADQRQDSLAELKHQIELNQAEKDYLRNQLSTIESSIERTAENSAVPLEISRHAVERQTNLADSLWQSLQELKIENQSQPRVVLLELAKIPQTANHSRQLRGAGAAGLGAAMLVVLLIGYREWHDCRVRSPEDISSRSTLPVFGAAVVPGQRGRRSDAGNPNRAESGVREAAARLMLHNQPGDPIPSMMVTSSVAAEPRYLVALELAVAFLQLRRRVLLIDCDLDSTDLAQFVNADRLPGLQQLSSSSQQIAKSDVTRLVVESIHQGIDLMPIGYSADRRWVDPRVLRLTIDSLREEYDAIVVNGPALIGSAESLLLAAEVDTTLCSVFVNTSRWDQFVAAQQSIRQAGLSIGGSILHSGSQSSFVQRLPRGEASRTRESSDTAVETALCNQLDEMQQALQQSQADASSPQTVESTHQNPTA